MGQIVLASGLDHNTTVPVYREETVQRVVVLCEEEVEMSKARQEEIG